MHDATTRMSEQVVGPDGMSDSLKDMNGQMDQMVDTTNNMYSDLRQGGAAAMRNDQLASMIQSENMESKVASAAGYLFAFEFQSWKGAADGSAWKFNRLLLAAAEEFFAKVRKFLPKRLEGEFKVDLANADRSNLYAIAMALDQVNPGQESGPSHRRSGQWSFLRMIQAGISDHSRWEAGLISFKKLTPVSREVIANLDAATYLLIARMNILAAMVLAKVSRIQSHAWSQVLAYFFDWSAIVPRLNIVQLREYTQWMHESNRIREFLSRHNALKFDRTIVRVFENMKYDVERFKRSAKKTDRAGIHRNVADWNDAMRDLFEEIDEYRKHARGAT